MHIILTFKINFQFFAYGTHIWSDTPVAERFEKLGTGVAKTYCSRRLSPLSAFDI